MSSRPSKFYTQIHSLVEKLKHKKFHKSDFESAAFENKKLLTAIDSLEKAKLVHNAQQPLVEAKLRKRDKFFNFFKKNKHGLSKSSARIQCRQSKRQKFKLKMSKKPLSVSDNHANNKSSFDNEVIFDDEFYEALDADYSLMSSFVLYPVCDTYSKCDPIEISSSTPNSSFYNQGPKIKEVNYKGEKAIKVSSINSQADSIFKPVTAIDSFTEYNNFDSLYSKPLSNQGVIFHHKLELPPRLLLPQLFLDENIPLFWKS